ncbi:MAG: PD-(D/E)XK nuclease family protein [Microcella pacifica]|uniref:PD-(D/E)XK nuclease family protein n=1 Tax=Microcella pacifica TaxID=2591847 RepID=UPI00331624F9
MTTTTLLDLVTDLVARSGSAAGRRPLTPPARQAAMRAALAREPGPFAHVAEEPVTIRALARASEQLDGTPEEALADATGLTAEVVHVHRRAMASVRGGWVTPDEALRVAHRALADSTVRARLGTVILFALEGEHTPAERQLLEVLRASNGIIEVPLEITAVGLVAPRAISASDADEEARAVARAVVELLRAGVAGHRIGVFWGSPEPYRTLLHTHLAEAGVTISGPGARTLADTPLARGLLRLLDVNPDDLDPLAVLGVLADGALRWSEKPLPSSAEAERITARDRVEEPSETAVGVFFGNTEPEAADDSASDSAVDDRQRRQWKRQTLWDEYLAALSASVRAVRASSSWAQAAQAVEHLIDEHLSAPPWPESDEAVLAREQLARIVGELVHLDAIDGDSPTPQAIRSSLESLLSDARARHGRHGTGVAVGSLASGVARDLDHVFVVGLAEGVAPARSRDDALLPDEVRQRWGLPTLKERASRARSRFLGTLTSARISTTVLIPRGDLRSGGDREPSRWLSGILAPDAELTVVQAHHHALLTGSPAVSPVPATAEEWRIRNDLTAGSWAGVPDVELVARARTLRSDRFGGRFTRFTGNLTEVRELIRFTNAPVAATQLEEWVASPLFFFVRHVLGVRLLDLQVEDFEPTALDRGNIQHAILEAYTNTVLGADDGDAALATLDLLLETAERVFRETRRSGWIEHLWKRDQRRIRAQLTLWWHREVESSRWSPRSAEQAFGLDVKGSLDPLTFTLDDDTVISFRGKVDRIDHSDEGIRVVDYKGRRPPKLELSADDPTGTGQKYQLAVYGLFAESLRDELNSTREVRTEYDHLASPENPVLGFTMTPESIDVLRTDVSAVVQGIQAGVFPARPARGALEKFSTLSGEADLARLWEKLRVTPDMAPYARFFLEPEEAES